MDRNNYIGKLQDLIQKRDLFLTLTLVLLGIVILQSLILIKAVGNQRIVLVPMPLKQAGWVDKTRISDSYLVEMTRYYSTLFLNCSPDNSEARIAEVLHYSASESYGELKKQLVAESEALKRKHISTWFSPVSVAVNTNDLTADITGDLHVLVGANETNIVRATYRAHYVYRNGALLISGFNEVTKDDN